MKKDILKMLNNFFNPNSDNIEGLNPENSTSGNETISDDSFIDDLVASVCDGSQQNCDKVWKY